MRLSDRTLRATVAAVLAATALAGCGGSSSDTATATTTTATTANGKPTTLTGSQTADLTAARQSIVNAASGFLVTINRCPALKDRKACVRRAVKRADPVIRKSRDTIAALAASVGGDCAAQIGDVRSKITDVTDTLGPMAESTSTGNLRNAQRLGSEAQVSLRAFATSALIVDRAC